jgi:Tfp pilus assembly protein FimT
MLVVLTILSIALMIEWPSQKKSHQLSTAKLVGSQLFQAIQIARNEALLRNKKIILCPSNNQQTCSGVWRDGYIIKTDSRVLYSLRFVIKEGEIAWQHFPFYRDSLEFLGNGFANVENGSFGFYLMPKKELVWSITVNQAGRARFVFASSSPFPSPPLRSDGGEGTH